MGKTDFAELKEKLINRLESIDTVVSEDYEPIISELIDIIQSQSEALRLSPRYDEDGFERHSFIRAQGVLSETTTRLQKLMDGIESGK